MAGAVNLEFHELTPVIGHAAFGDERLGALDPGLLLGRAGLRLAREPGALAAEQVLAVVLLAAAFFVTARLAGSGFAFRTRGAMGARFGARPIAASNSSSACGSRTGSPAISKAPVGKPTFT